MQPGPNKLNLHSHKSCKIKFMFKGKVQNLISMFSCDIFSCDVFSANNETQRASVMQDGKKKKSRSAKHAFDAGKQKE